MLFALTGALHAGGVFQEDDGLLIIELESAAYAGAWKFETSVPGYTGSGYLRWNGPNFFNQPGHDTFGFEFDIHNPGPYSFRIRNFHDHPDHTEENDVWVRVDDGPWIKCFSGENNAWNWQTFHDLSHTNKPPAEYDLEEGRHTIEFSGRSHNFRMDRFHMYLPGTPGALAKNKPESDCIFDNRRPVASVRISPDAIPLGDNHNTVVTLDGSDSFDPDGQALTYFWELRGGRLLPSSDPRDPIVRATFDGGMAQPIRLTVTDDHAEPMSDRETVFLNVVGTQGTLRGEPVAWHPMEVSFHGPMTNEEAEAPNPFMDYRLIVKFVGPTGEETKVHGFYDGDGNGSGEGDVWKARFAPDQGGLWRYEASFREGESVAIEPGANAGSPLAFDGAAGTFGVLARDPNAEGFLSQGLLEYVGEHYLKFRDGGFFIKGGTDSPENFLGYKGFDDIQDAGGIGIVHEYGPHESDWVEGDPLFTSNTTGYSSKGIIGALNYLSSEHVNSVYFLPMNLGGDGQDTCPFVGYDLTPFDKCHYDVSRMHQWNQVFEHAQRKGIQLHFVLAETEFANETWLDSGNLGPERKLFYREMVARFGHSLAIKWNLSEENDYSVLRLKKFAECIDSFDPYDHPISVHTHFDNPQDYPELLGHPLFSATSIQYSPALAAGYVEEWRQNSANAGRKWVLDMDENAPWDTGLSPTNAAELRKKILFDVYFSGGQVEWYAGYHDLPVGGDVKLEDFRTRKEMWRYMWYARRFMQDNLPFWRMEPRDDLLVNESQYLGGGHVFALEGETYAVYLPKASPVGALRLNEVSGTFRGRWWNPRSGEFEGDPIELDGGTQNPLGATPSDQSEDWVLLVERVVQ